MTQQEEPAPKPSGDKGVVGEIAKRHADDCKYAAENNGMGAWRERLHQDRATLLALHKPLAERREGLADLLEPFVDARLANATARKYRCADAVIAWIEGASK